MGENQSILAVLATLAVVTAGATASAQPAKKKRIAESEIAALGTTLVSSDSDAAKQAAATLGAVRNKSATVALTDALALGLSRQVALSALAALEERADATALDTLEYYSKVRSKELRVGALQAASATTSSRGDGIVIAGLSDPSKSVRGVAANLAGLRGLTKASERLIELLVEGEKPASQALGLIANSKVARAVAETIGVAPDALVADALGTMLLRPDFGPDTLRLEVVRALGKVPKGEGAAHLAAYVAATPAKPPRASRREAEQLLGDGL